MNARPRSTLKELDDTEDYLGSTGIAKSDFGACKKYLKMVEEHGVRRPTSVANAARCVLADIKKSKLSKREQYQAMELLAYACIDTGDTETAETLVDQLAVVFPGSSRVGRLKGAMLESNGKFGDALKIYSELLEKSPAEQRVWKRRVGCYKASGKPDKAIESLSEYLNTFMGDVNAWEELANLYCEKRMFAQSIFCYEEVICAQPQVAKHHRHIAEVYYTWGGYANLQTARKYYAAALDMSTASDLRAMYSLVLVDKKFKEYEKKGKKKADSVIGSGDVGSDLGKDAAVFLPRIYKAACSSLLPVVEKQMASVGL